MEKSPGGSGMGARRVRLGGAPSRTKSMFFGSFGSEPICQIEYHNGDTRPREPQCCVVQEVIHLKCCPEGPSDD